MKVQNGDRVKDAVTGYEGTVVARTEYLNQCVRVQIQAQALQPTGIPVESIHVDEDQVYILEVAANRPDLRIVDKPQATGGPAAATRNRAPTHR